MHRYFAKSGIRLIPVTYDWIQDHNLSHLWRRPRVHRPTRQLLHMLARRTRRAVHPFGCVLCRDTPFPKSQGRVKGALFKELCLFKEVIGYSAIDNFINYKSRTLVCIKSYGETARSPPAPAGNTEGNDVGEKVNVVHVG